MALDTRSKRSSAINVSSPWRGLLPTPDASVSQGDRQHYGFMYSGVLATTAEEELITGPPRAITGLVFSLGGRDSVVFTLGGREGLVV